MDKTVENKKETHDEFWLEQRLEHDGRIRLDVAYHVCVDHRRHPRHRLVVAENKQEVVWYI